MSEKLKVLSDKDVVKLFERYGAVVKRVTGSHTRVFWSHKSNSISITIPLHNELKKGTLKSITKDFEDCFGRETVRFEFYHE